MTTETAGLTAAVYARLSRDTDTSTSVDGQLANARRWATDHGVTITHELIDSGVSGGKARDNAAEALRLLRSREVVVLLVDKVDRFGRRGLPDVVALLDTVDATPGALVVAVSDGLRSDSPDWSLRLGLYAVLARAELERISARNRASASRLRERGRWPGGPTPFGYVVHAAQDGNKELIPYAKEAAIIADAADRVVSGEPLFSIVKDLNTRNVPSPGYARALKSGRTPSTRRTWTTDALRRLLCSPTVRGYSPDGHGDLQRSPDGLPREVWPPLLPESRWRRVRAILGADEREQRARARAAGELSPAPPLTRERAASRVLSGVIRCGRCGRNLFIKYNGPRANRPGQVFYGCPDQPQARCRGTLVVASRAEDYVVAEFLRVRGDAPLLTPREIDAPATIRLAEVSAAMDDTLRAMRTRYSPDLGARMERLQAEREALERAPRTPSLVWEDSGETYRSRWEATTDTTARRDLLRANLSATLLPSPRPRAPIDSRIRILWQPAAVLGHSEATRHPLAARVPVDDE